RGRVAFVGPVTELGAGGQVGVGMLREGARGYVAVEGGLAPDLVTRPLRTGDDLIRADIAATRTGRISRGAGSLLDVRAVAGPQFDHFREPARFFGTEYTLSPQSDRRGLR